MRIPWAFLFSIILFSDAQAESAPVSFNRDIKSILSDRCFLCHGPASTTRAKNGLRLDIPEVALSYTSEGVPALAPGKPQESLVSQRIVSKDPNEVMPPPDSGLSLTEKEIALLNQWIAEGAVYEKHWSFIPPERPEPPVINSDWSGHPIDRFIYARLAENDLAPSPRTDEATWLRRVSLDLTGLPPTPEERRDFLNDISDLAEERVIDRLLASEAYGERMAVDWLDLARYADTNGYQYDMPRTMWRWRDWVIEAFNRNLPFDQFATEQLAGDLLPDPSLDQLIATGFNRNHPFTIEGGVVDEEYRIHYVSDRTFTFGATFLGLTLECAKCHDHKYDPLSQKEYFQIFAFFNNVPEKGFHGGTPLFAPPAIKAPTREQQTEQERLVEQLSKTHADSEAAEVLKARQKELDDAIVNTMIMKERETRRTTHILDRGQYDQPRDKVTPGTPEALPSFPSNAPQDRLGLARWLTSPENPLFSRVTVNRLWGMLFGTGIVATSDDFGAQGAWPSHPELLDWLAIEFRESGWDVKRFLKMVALSETYRQSSHITPELAEIDPQNRLLARGPRHRLSAEMIRDQALAVSGLLTHEVGGPSVFPYQPPGLWGDLTQRPGFKMTYELSEGADLYRRSLYTFWKRAMPPSGLQTFDAPNREICVVDRPTTSTPLQALALLNDTTYLEAARALAQKVIQENDPTEERIRSAFLRVTGREADPEELRVLVNFLREKEAYYETQPEAAISLLSHGESPRDESIPAPEHAAMLLIASMVLNLDETINKE